MKRSLRCIASSVVALAVLTPTFALTAAAQNPDDDTDGPRDEQITPISALPDVQSPFLCTTEFNGLGQPIVDNQDREGTPVYPESEPGVADTTAEPLGWSRNCQADERVEYRYRDTAGDVQTLAADATELPDDIAYIDAGDLVGTDTLDLDGEDQIPFLYRYQRGTLPETRFIYSIAMLVPFEEVISSAETSSGQTASDWNDSLWNGRLVYSFGGGVGVGHSQGSLSGGDSQLKEALRLGHAVLYSSGTRTSVHYNLLLASRVASELKAHFISEFDEPLYTVGIGGSGGGIQQYVNAQNNPELLDALIPQYSYPDMTTQTINVGDCELLERYLDVTDGANTRWQNWDDRKMLQGQNSIEGFSSDWQEATGDTGSSECIEGWRGATPLALNPNFGLAADMDDVLIPMAGELLALAEAGEPVVPENFPDLGRLLRQSVDQSEWVNWTHWDDAAEAYGIDPDTGFARVPWDNVGVQYGLRAVANGTLTPGEFLDLNAKVGGWKPANEHVVESCGMVTQMTGETLGAFAKIVGICEGDELDQYSSRQMIETSAQGVTPRTEGDVDAITSAFASGLEFDGKLGRDIPILDVRHYLEHELDMHNVHQSFVVRERIRRAMGDAENQVIWWLDARPEENEDATDVLLDRAYRVMDEWVLNLADGATSSAAQAKPAAAVDTCWATDGAEIASGDDVWDGAVELALTGEGDWSTQAPTEVDGVTVGDCARAFPIHSTSRVVAGGPITNDVYKCHLKPVAQAIDDGDYGVWEPNDVEVEILEAIFADGVCDWSKRSVGYPGELTTVKTPGAPNAGVDAVGADDDGVASQVPWIFLGAVVALVVLGGLGQALFGGRGAEPEDHSPQA